MCKMVSEAKKASNKAYHQSPAGKKSMIISKWKQRGIIHDDYSELHDRYISTTNCDVCRIEFKDSFDRCLDHDHETGQFRQFLCRNCNTQDRWKSRI